MQCLGLTGACAAYSHCSATAWDLSGLDHSHAAIPQCVTRASCAQLLRSVLVAPPAVDLLEALCRCVYETGLLVAASVCVYITRLILLPLSFVLGVGAPSLSFAGFVFKAA